MEKLLFTPMAVQEAIPVRLNRSCYCGRKRKYDKGIFPSFLGVKTNNEAEYEAVIFGLRKIKALLGKEKIKNTEIEFRPDSQLIARQLNGEYKIEEKNYSRCLSKFGI